MYLSRNLHLPLLEVNASIGFLEVGSRQDLTPLEHHGRLDEGDDAAGTLEMTNIGFDRADPQWVRGWTMLRKCLVHRGSLDRVADLGTSPMHFGVPTVQRVQIGLFVDTLDEISLGIAVRNRDAFRTSVLVDASTHDYSANGVIVANCSVEWLDDHTANTFATSEPRLSPMVECISLAIFVKEPKAMCK